MDRRQFIGVSTAAFFSMLIGSNIPLPNVLKASENIRENINSSNVKNGPKPLPKITAAVDVLMPPDPDIENDFKGSDYNADWVVAFIIGDLGMEVVSGKLDEYAEKSAGIKDFLDCSEQEKLEAMQMWVLDADNGMRAFKDALTGLFTFSIVGTFEANTKEKSEELYQKMGWYDPEDPASTFRIPNTGYPDSFQFPISYKEGAKK